MRSTTPPRQLAPLASARAPAPLAYPLGVGWSKIPSGHRTPSNVGGGCILREKFSYTPTSEFDPAVLSYLITQPRMVVSGAVGAITAVQAGEKEAWKQDNQDKLGAAKTAERHLVVYIDLTNGLPWAAITDCAPPLAVPKLPPEITHLWPVAARDRRMSLSRLARKHQRTLGQLTDYHQPCDESSRPGLLRSLCIRLVLNRIHLFGLQ